MPARSGPREAPAATPRHLRRGRDVQIAWGCYAVLDPQWFFRITGLPLSNSPQIFACLGMVLGLYGVLYLDVARQPEHGWPAAAVGLTGKILGPLGLRGSSPPARLADQHRRHHRHQRSDVVVVLPFGCYLLDAWPDFRASWRSASR